MQVNPRVRKVQEKIVPKVVVRNVMFKRKATKVSIGGTEEQARKPYWPSVRTGLMKPAFSSEPSLIAFCLR